MFYPEFSNQQYEERLWPAVQFLEFIMRMAVRLKPREYGLVPKEDMKKGFAEFLVPMEFPPEAMALREDDHIVDVFIDNEFESIRAMAEDSLNRFPDGRGAVQDLIHDRSADALLLARLRESSSFRESVQEGKIQAWMADVQSRLLKERDTRNEKEGRS